MDEKIETQETQSKTKVKVPCEIYSRIVGYLTATQNWNAGKQQEFVERQTFHVPQNAEE